MELKLVKDDLEELAIKKALEPNGIEIAFLKAC